LSVNEQVGANGDHARALPGSNPTSGCGRKPQAQGAAPPPMSPSESGGDGGSDGHQLASVHAAKRAPRCGVTLSCSPTLSASLRAEDRPEVQPSSSYSFPYYHIYGETTSLGSQRSRRPSTGNWLRDDYLRAFPPVGGSGRGGSDSL